MKVAESSSFTTGTGPVQSKVLVPMTQDVLDRIKYDEYNRGHIDGWREGYDSGYEDGLDERPSEVPYH